MSAVNRDKYAALRAEREGYAAMPSIGERFTVPRDGKAGVDTLLYRPKEIPAGGSPLILNMHGGAWIGGDAMLLESFCRMLSDELGALVVNVNYKKSDVEPFPYAIEEVADAAEYFIARAPEYGVNPAKCAVAGHSAGAQLAAGAALLLKRRGVGLACQLLVYPCVDMSGIRNDYTEIMSMLFPDGGEDSGLASPLLASDDELRGIAPAIFVISGIDDLRAQGVAYAKRLIELAVPVSIKEWPSALHGFVEVNRPDYPAGDSRQTPEQAEYCREAEMYAVSQLAAVFAR